MQMLELVADLCAGNLWSNDGYSMIEEGINMASVSDTHMRDKTVAHAKKLTIKDPEGKGNNMVHW